MAISYYGYKISPNQLETDEGFLICKNVPIARTGTQKYLSSELGLDGDKIVEVIRPAEEVFSDATIASFEGKPVTDDHPSDLLDAATTPMHSKGHVQNVRRGVGEWKDFIVADLHIQDERLIDEIKGGKREVSCGYTTEYVDNGDGTYTQTKIRGNHVAVVDEGRAGHSAAIMDSINSKVEKIERKSMKKNIFATLFGHAAEGKSADEISKMMMDTADALGEAEESKEEPKADETADKCGTKDEDYKDKLFETIDALGKRLDSIEARLPKVEEQKDTDPIEEALKAMEAEKEDEDKEEPSIDKSSTDVDAEEAVTVPAESMDEGEPKAEEKKVDASMDSVKALLRAVKPVIASMKDADDKKAVTDALLGSLKTSKKANDSAKLAQALNNMKANSTAQGMNIEDVQRAYDQCNPHLRKENK